MTDAPSILVVDDHEIVRRGCRELLEHGEFSACYEAATGEEGWRLFLRENPRVVILDLSIGDMNGLEMITRIRDHGSFASIIVFTMHDDPTYAARVLRAGAEGYITKTSPPESLLEGVRRVLRGTIYLSPDMAQALALSKLSALTSPMQALTQREFDVFQLVVDGHSNAAIAGRLGLSQKSVSNYVVRIKHDLGVDSVAEMVRLALRYKLVQNGESAGGENAGHGAA